ncbi:hypothetical protein Lal_00038643 [Lupinus albus]|nr:hypothetical protein Lal_00038643 [Lupinus albus]
MITYLRTFGMAEKLPSEQGITSGNIYLLNQCYKLFVTPLLQIFWISVLCKSTITLLPHWWNVGGRKLTFYLPNGECTITLEDFAYELGLPIDGDAVTGVTSMELNNVCLNLLGAIPTDRQVIGQRIQMSWLDSTFQQLPEDADDIVIHQHARAFILRMISGFLMPNTSDSRVHLMYLPLLEDLSETFQYSWRFTVLVCLYRDLCRATLISRQIEIGGCLLLLQSWAYNRIPMFAPRLHDNNIHLFPLVRRWSQHLITTNIIRSMLDCLRINHFVWTPYKNMNFMGQIPDIARARVPLISFALVE